jgi:bisanhydrobacterioruberin hydratase
MKNNLYRGETIAKRIIIILYSVGILGLLFPATRSIFIGLTPFILIISFVLLPFFQSPPADSKTALLFLVFFLVSFFIEVAGVHTGRIFGSYTYGKGLGIKILETPVIIGLNWVLLIYCTAAILEKFAVSTVVKITGAATLMVILDFILEHVAPKLDMWAFEGGAAPLRNYIAWFIIAFIFHSVLRWAGIKISNRVAPVVFYCQGIFFLLLFIVFNLIA